MTALLWVFGVIGLVQVGDIENRVVELLKNTLGARFGEEVAIDSGISLPDFAYNKQRKQYYSTAILKIISDSIKDSKYKKILGVVDKDLNAYALCSPNLEE